MIIIIIQCGDVKLVLKTEMMFFLKKCNLQHTHMKHVIIITTYTYKNCYYCFIIVIIIILQGFPFRTELYITSHVLRAVSLVCLLITLLTYTLLRYNLTHIHTVKV